MEVISNLLICHSFCTDIIDNVWCLVVSWDRLNTSAFINLQLCSIPVGADNINAKVKIYFSTDKIVYNPSIGNCLFNYDKSVKNEMGC